MKTDFKVIVCILLVFIQFSIQAQKNGLDNMLSVELKKTGVVEQQNQVKGYYSFYFVEKADKENSIYAVKIFDENAKEIINEKFKEINKLMLVAATFDNEAILLKFTVTNSPHKGTKYYIFNKEKQFKPISKPTTNEKDGYINYGVGEPEALGRTLFGIQEKGFLNYAPYKESKTEGYEIVMIGSKGEKKWVHQSQTKSGEKDIANILAVGKNNVYNIISNYESARKYDSPTGNYITQSINSIDLSTGRKIFETKMEDEQLKYQILSGQESEAGTGLTVFGLTYPKSVKMDIEAPWGMFTATLDINGNILTKKTVSLDNTINKFFPLESYKSFRELGNVYFHNFLQTSDGRIFAIAENYDIKGVITLTSFMGVNTGKSPNRFVTKDLLIFEFNADFTISGIKAIPKSITKLEMPSSAYGYATKIANVMKHQWGFGYLYSQLSQDKSSFIIYYKDIFKEDNTRFFNLEAIVHKDGTYMKDKLNLKVDNDLLTPFPAKYGHILLSGYLKDEKKQEMRLERINF